MYVQIKDLNFSYKHAKKQTISNFNLEIKEGEIVAILGHSGSGKSTVLRLLTGLETPSSGEIVINQQPVYNSKVDLEPENRKVGMVFQDYALFPHMTVAKNIQYGLHGMSSEEKNKRTSEMLSLVSLTGFEKRYPYELSGGQQQRVALARAIAPSPTILLLDEPFSNLDHHLQVQIREDLKEIIRNAGTTAIFVTHNEEDAKAIADQVVRLKDGVIIEKGAVSEVL